MKNAYKQTEVGIIPEDWECKELQNYFSFISYGFTNPMPTVSDGVFMITANDINGGRIKFETARKTTEKAYQSLLTDKSRPKKNDILLTKDGSLGRLALVGDEKICINQSVAVIRPNEKVYPLYLKLLLESSYYQKTMIDNAGGSTIKHIYITIVNKMKIAIPPTKAEQTAIATALSDVDALINALDKLITKKRLIKQGAMQQLLSGKKRLAGFSGEWEIKTFGDIFDFLTTATYSRADLSEHDEVFYIHYGDIHTKWNYFLDFENNSPPTIKNEKAKKYPFIKDGDIIIADASEDYAGICKSVEIKNLGTKKAISGLHTFLIRDNKNVFVNGFKGYIQSMNFFRNQVNSLATGLKVYGVSKTNLKTIQILVPPKEEQTAIAEILSDMDKEIEALERRRTKTLNLKQGMMQTLLTGKIRLTGVQAPLARAGKACTPMG